MRLLTSLELRKTVDENDGCFGVFDILGGWCL